jgi:hypothetical protein
VKITAVKPQKGAAGTPVMIFGSSLTSNGDPEVTMGGLHASVNKSTDTVIHVTVPSQLAAVTVDVQVITPDGRTAVLPGAFEVTGQPQRPGRGWKRDRP